jgi:hypothetical protein
MLETPEEMRKNLDVNGKIILKCILKEWNVRVWVESI